MSGGTTRDLREHAARDWTDTYRDENWPGQSGGRARTERGQGEDRARTGTGPDEDGDRTKTGRAGTGTRAR